MDRRSRQGLQLQFSDYPVNATYIKGVGEAGATLLHPSKWLNATSVRMDAQTAATVAALPYVRLVKHIPKVIVDLEPVPTTIAREGYAAGFSHVQTAMIGLDKLHKNGYNGHGILISMMDNGFRDADKNPYLSHLIHGDRLVATWDFVNNEADVFDQGDHGQFTLSILAGWGEPSTDTAFWFAGSAHGASFILCHTESDASETHQEEDNWVRAMEFADSIGADLFSTSLGYRTLDDDSYTYADLDGNTTIITIAADLAASKGIMVMNSAGNDGAAKMLAPSDGDSVMSVGAVNGLEVIAGFSAQGPSFDGRIKPDISAMGEGCSYIRSSGTLSQGNGTSFSCPVAAGMAACLLQSAPETANMDLFDAIIRSADRFENPDTFYGHGIPDAAVAYRILTGKELPAVAAMDAFNGDSTLIYPNPAIDYFNVAIDNGSRAYQGTFELADAGGRVVWSKSMVVAPFYNVLHFTRADDYAFLPSGRYVLRVLDSDREVRHSSKLNIYTER
ncbi:MAG TPA: S8 family peptidase [Bacteroidia bacterium]|nr:S8 family peptidase [Bacteroidia bacterium]